MRYLIDTHIFLWWLNGDKRLKTPIREVIENKENQIIASVINGIEISIKTKRTKIKLSTTIDRMFEISGFKVLDVNLSHVLELDKLSLYKNHKDPFDRILISQARVENLTFITSDEKIWKYDLPLLKA